MLVVIDSPGMTGMRQSNPKSLPKAFRPSVLEMAPLLGRNRSLGLKVTSVSTVLSTACSDLVTRPRPPPSERWRCGDSESVLQRMEGGHLHQVLVRVRGGRDGTGRWPSLRSTSQGAGTMRRSGEGRDSTAHSLGFRHRSSCWAMRRSPAASSTRTAPRSCGRPRRASMGTRGRWSTSTTSS